MISLQEHREDGQDLLEYGILASLIAIVVLAAVKLVASQIMSVFWGAIALSSEVVVLSVLCAGLAARAVDSARRGFPTRSRSAPRPTA